MKTQNGYTHHNIVGIFISQVEGRYTTLIYDNNERVQKLFIIIII